jgi:4-hydroxysphinganine ceramide fatty acyl 2-hydroxylase
MPAFTPKQIAKHNHSNSTWVIVDDKVYDVTQFTRDHPGGDDLILAHAGTDVTEVMKDKLEHEHSDAAYSILKEYRIGTVDRVTEDKEEDETEYYIPTDPSIDFKTNRFLDLQKPMFPQLWRSKFSKQLYLDQVHKPRYLPEPAPYFGENHILEPFTKTPWYMIPIVWVPFVLYQLYKSSQQGAIITTLQGFSTGIFAWTLLEYTLHRFLFHMDEQLPDHWLAFLFHFTLHGIHHYLPMDK